MTVKCPWCGKVVAVLRGRLKPHIVTKGVQCVGNGFEIHHVQDIHDHNPAPPAPQRKKR